MNQICDCPFCMNEVKLKEIYNVVFNCNVFAIECPLCLIKTVNFVYKEDVIKIWNQRKNNEK